jgi:hypothetical protein
MDGWSVDDKTIHRDESFDTEICIILSWLIYYYRFQKEVVVMMRIGPSVGESLLYNDKTTRYLKL